VELGPYAVVGDNVIIDDEATVSQSVVVDNTYVGKLVKLHNRLADGKRLVDLTSGDHVEVADPWWLSETPATLSGSPARRYADVALAAALLLLLLPVGLPWGLLWWLAAGKPLTRVTHVRPGAGGQPLTLYRFPASGRNGLAAWLTYWQQRLEFERLPELLSVLRGELGLVGGKPLTAAEAASVAEAWQVQASAPTPGFTGLWYVQTQRRSGLDEILVTDAYFEATRSWRNDLRILWQTPAAWVRRLRQSRDTA
jgi:lipopolysaccharide/colanic/teichoic acid biosynthesis glycosyltransferase